MLRWIPPVFVLSLASCSPGGVAVPVPWIVLPDSVAIQGAGVGQMHFIEVEVHNSGTGEARVSLRIDEPFRVSSGDVIVQPGASVLVPISFHPESYDVHAGELVARTTGQAVRVPVSGKVDPDSDGDGAVAREAGGDDCDDDDPAVHPGAVELCNGVDDDCNGLVDDAPVDPVVWYLDTDGDGYGGPVTRRACNRPSGYADRDGDCNDSDPKIHPGATEIWYDGVDQDCDGASDYDQDRDGYENIGFGGDDCLDTNPRVHPGAYDPPYDGIDQDCDGWSDFDADRDGRDSADYGGTDCDDDDPGVHPGARELDDGVDQDCDGFIDEDFTFRGHLVVTELLVEPLGAASPAGQFIELHNRSRRTIDLTGGVVEVADGAALLSGVRVASGGFALLCGDTDPSANGGLACDAALPAALTANDHVTIKLHLVLDEVDWTDWTLTDGASLELDPRFLHPDRNDDPVRWCAATEDLGSGDLGTPGQLGPECP